MKKKAEEVKPESPVTRVPAADNAAQAKAKTVTKSSFGTTYFYKEPALVDGKPPKLPKQADQIVAIVKEAGDKGIGKTELLEEMKKVVETRQPIERILGYYQPRLTQLGFITMGKSAAAPVKEEPKAEQPAAQ